MIDGCDHEWFEDRAPRCALLVYVDDATGDLMELRFAQAESAFDYFAATRAYLARHGRPAAVYSDKHSIFRVARGDSAGRSLQRDQDRLASSKLTLREKDRLRRARESARVPAVESRPRPRNRTSLLGRKADISTRV